MLVHYSKMFDANVRLMCLLRVLYSIRWYRRCRCRRACVCRLYRWDNFYWWIW